MLCEATVKRQAFTTVGVNLGPSLLNRLSKLLRHIVDASDSIGVVICARHRVNVLGSCRSLRDLLLREHITSHCGGLEVTCTGTVAGRFLVDRVERSRGDICAMRVRQDALAFCEP
jgi:hypothetical protein